MSSEYYELSPEAQKAVQQRDWSSMLAGITVHKLGENSRSFYDTERNDIYDKKIGDGALGPYGYQDYYQQDFRRGLFPTGIQKILWRISHRVHQKKADRNGLPPPAYRAVRHFRGGHTLRL